MASSTRGSVGVVACMSRYMGRAPSSMTVACLRMPATGERAASPDRQEPGSLKFSGSWPVSDRKAF